MTVHAKGNGSWVGRSIRRVEDPTLVTGQGRFTGDLPAAQSPSCVYGASHADTTVVLFGDSHAAQWFPAIDSIARRRGWRLVALTKTACPVPQVVVINGRLARRYTECEAWRRSAIDRISALRPALVVAASARSYKLLVGGGQQEWTESSTDARDDWRAGRCMYCARAAAWWTRAGFVERSQSRCEGRQYSGDCAR